MLSRLQDDVAFYADNLANLAEPRLLCLGSEITQSELNIEHLKQPIPTLPITFYWSEESIPIFSTTIPLSTRHCTYDWECAQVAALERELRQTLCLESNSLLDLLVPLSSVKHSSQASRPISTTCPVAETFE